MPVLVYANFKGGVGKTICLGYNICIHVMQKMQLILILLKIMRK